MFAVADSTGQVGIFQLVQAGGGGWTAPTREGPAAALGPSDLVHAHPKRTYSLAFLDYGTRLATAGIGGGAAVKVWDLLLPPGRSCVGGVTCHEGHANSLVFMPAPSLLVSGGQKGDIVLSDPNTCAVVRCVLQTRAAGRGRGLRVWG